MKPEFKSLFKPQILARGLEYYKNGAVSNLTIDETSITADVRGSEPYQVEIKLSGDRITGMNCDCPYADGGENCKHMAAVIYAANDMPVKDAPHWNTALDSLSEQMLRDFVRNLAACDETLQERLIRMASDNYRDHTQWEADLERIIDRYDDGYGFLDYDCAYDCMIELTKYLDDILPSLLETNSIKDAAALTELVYKTAFDQEMDDSDGGLSQVSFCCHEAWKKILSLASDTQKEDIFTSLHQLLGKDDWNSGTYDLEEVILSLEWPLSLQQKHLEWLDKNLSYSRFRDRVTLMQRMGADSTEVIAFLEKYREHEESYNLLLPLYESTDISMAIQLVQEHRAKNKDKLYWHSDTKKLIDLFETAGETAKYERELRYLILDCGCIEVNYVARLKAVTDSNDWYELFVKILNATKYTEQRMALLELEGMYDVLLMEMKECKNLNLFLQYESSLRQRYPEQTLDIYTTLLKEAMYHACDRSSYNRIAAHLKNLKPYPDGKEAAKALAQYWYSVHNNRPAMKDELKKAGYALK